jgi:hypothetical protein
LFEAPFKLHTLRCVPCTAHFAGLSEFSLADYPQLTPANTGITKTKTG